MGEGIYDDVPPENTYRHHWETTKKATRIAATSRSHSSTTSTTKGTAS
ncbi:MAG: hypothetical protein AVDCRST_MAG02-315 [uncultured Rubrobacteraceae bacterium]|uniref:Uncharacterized protein n=1 Tax=uncultured Rubrobacteraceae bacterium TaxID=349277 RepID=A0A6J4QJJ7_9ACTN|nr:MAG: hypothetical protein AVDCRST_MAG02-315 [uncultured Rubrobacteraceae bacterium]